MPFRGDGRSGTFLHPASGLLILGLDWLFFSGSLVTLGLSTPALALLGFGTGSVGTAFVQRQFHRDNTGKSVLKGLLAGITVGIPLPIAGTAVGGGVLALSGLDKLWKRSDRKTGESPRVNSNQDPKMES